MPKPIDPPPRPGRRHPPPGTRKSVAKEAARMRRALVRNRGGDGGDRPDHLAYLAVRGLWIDGVDWTTVTDAEVIARTLAGEPPEPPRGDEEDRRLDALILKRLARLAQDPPPAGESPAANRLAGEPRRDGIAPDAA